MNGNCSITGNRRGYIEEGSASPLAAVSTDSRLTMNNNSAIDMLNRSFSWNFEYSPVTASEGFTGRVDELHLLRWMVRFAACGLTALYFKAPALLPLRQALLLAISFRGQTKSVLSAARTFLDAAGVMRALSP
jgi:hypothetical protein